MIGPSLIPVVVDSPSNLVHKYEVSFVKNDLCTGFNSSVHVVPGVFWKVPLAEEPFSVPRERNQHGAREHDQHSLLKTM